MSVLTPKRVFLFAALLLAGTTAFANNPSPRTSARMAYDPSSGMTVLFGGRGAFDGATQLAHSSDETWFWNGSSWLQRFPATRPAPRSAHAMVTDTVRNRVVLFGGRREPLEALTDAILLNDTWVWKDQAWSQIVTANAPSVRHQFGYAYDPVRDRIVVFGGLIPDVAGEFKNVYDTWEFDGTNWSQVGSSTQPEVASPSLVYDAKRNEVLMIGVDADDFTKLMYRYDGAAKTWTRITPQTLPTCVSGGHMNYVPASETVVYTGGVCLVGTPGLEEVFEWDGSNWTKTTTVNATGRSYTQAVAYDVPSESIVLFGGSFVGSSFPSTQLTTYREKRFRFPRLETRPQPRSLAGFQTDTVSGNVWLVGGLIQDGSGYLGEFWGYRDNQWFPLIVTGAPFDCVNPLSAFDSDRGKLIVTCLGATVYEWDFASFTWKTIASTKTPDVRRFAALAYDRTLKKIVMFGGYGGQSSYFDETWTWDGSNWTEVNTKGDGTPDNRALMAMWYDPILKKTVLYGGLGRANLNQKITRYSDMWAFDGSNWSKLNVTATPGERLGAQITVNPVTGKLLLFGGLRAERDENDKLRQFYANDTWVWDGGSSSWTRLEPLRSPDARENGMMAWDPKTNEVILFGGYYAGFYFSDRWAFDGVNWRPLLDQGTRRRPSGSAN